MSQRWPLFDLRIYVEDLELRIPTFAQLEALADFAEAGLHDPAEMPFGVPWTDAAPVDRARSTIQHHWKGWGTLSPESWFLSFVVLKEGVVVGNQALDAEKFAVTREVSSGSWLGREHQGRGIGKLMRAAILGLAFDGLGALSATSGAWTDNPSSIGVSRALGYHDDGIMVDERRGQREVQRRFRMTLEQWRAAPRPEITFEGLAPCLEMLGATITTGPGQAPRCD